MDDATETVSGTETAGPDTAGSQPAEPGTATGAARGAASAVARFVAGTADETARRFTPIDAVPVRHPWRWFSAAVLILIFAIFAQSLVKNPNYRWDVVATYILDVNVVQGVGWTLLLTVAAMAIAIVLAILLAFMRQAENPIMRVVSWLWVWVFRGTPVYTQLIFWGLLPVLYPRLVLGVPFTDGPGLFSLSTQDVINAVTAAILGLALNESAYLAEIFRAGLKSVDSGQVEAAEALGMRKGKIMVRIVLPQAMRVIVPPTGNETIGMLKTTSLVLAVPFTLELMYATNSIANRSYLPIPLLIVAACWYLAITSVLMVGQHYLERYYSRGVDSRIQRKPKLALTTEAAG